MVTIHEALTEAQKYTTTEKLRYDCSIIQLDDRASNLTVSATDGKVLYQGRTSELLPTLLVRYEKGKNVPKPKKRVLGHAVLERDDRNRPARIRAAGTWFRIVEANASPIQRLLDKISDSESYQVPVNDKRFMSSFHKCVSKARATKDVCCRIRNTLVEFIDESTRERVIPNTLDFNYHGPWIIIDPRGIKTRGTLYSITVYAPKKPWSTKVNAFVDFQFDSGERVLTYGKKTK
jgi:hypothetical protein